MSIGNRHDDHLGRMLAAMEITDPDFESHLEWWMALDQKRKERKNARSRTQTVFA